MKPPVCTGWHRTKQNKKKQKQKRNKQKRLLTNSRRAVGPGVVPAPGCGIDGGVLGGRGEGWGTLSTPSPCLILELHIGTFDFDQKRPWWQQEEEQRVGRAGEGWAGIPVWIFFAFCCVILCVGAFIPPDAVHSGQKEEAFFLEVHRAEISPLPLGQEYPIMSPHRPVSPTIAMQSGSCCT